MKALRFATLCAKLQYWEAQNDEGFLLKISKYKKLKESEAKPQRVNKNLSKFRNWASELYPQSMEWIQERRWK